MVTDTYYAPEGIPGFYGAPSTQQNDSIPYLPDYIASSEQHQQHQDQQQQSLSQSAPSTIYPYSPDSYSIQVPITIQPDISSPSFWQGSGSNPESGPLPETRHEDERGPNIMVQKMAGIFGVERGEDDGTTELLLKLGKKAYVAFFSFSLFLLLGDV